MAKERHIRPIIGANIHDNTLIFLRSADTSVNEAQRSHSIHPVTGRGQE